MGKLKSVEEFLSISDVFLLPSETESFGLVKFELLKMSSEVGCCVHKYRRVKRGKHRCRNRLFVGCGGYF